MVTFFVINVKDTVSTYILLLHSGKMFSLMMAEKLGDYIVGTAVETIETEKLIKEFENVIVDDVYGAGASIEKVTNDLQEKLNEKGVKLNTMAVENIYNETPTTKANTNIWYSAKNITDATKLVSPVRVLFFCFFKDISCSQLFMNYFSHLCLECKGNIRRRRKCQVFRLRQWLLVRSRRNVSLCQAFRDSQSSHRKEWFHAGLRENQFLVHPTNHSTRSDSYDTLSVLVFVFHFLLTAFSFCISLMTRLKQFVSATNYRI